MLLERLRRRTLWFGVASGVLTVVGMAGYVGGRMTADYRLVGLVMFSTYLVLAGLVLFAVALFINTPRMHRPLVSWAMGGLLILYGILLVTFPYDRAAAVPMAVITVFLVVSIVAGWKDLCNPHFWKADSESLG